jgi:thiamine pyrophosphokinase
VIQPWLTRAGPVTLVGGGPVDGCDLATCLGLSQGLVAADGGADTLCTAGHAPDAVIGDMDSLSPAARAAFADVLHPVAEQDSTDFEKCLTRIAAPVVLALGVTGGRVDHTLAALNTLARHPARHCVLIGQGDVVTLVPPRLALDLAPGSRVSLFPMAAVRGTSTGLHWPMDGIAFAPDGRSGTSNHATGPVQMTVDAPGMLVIMPRAALAALLAGLAAAPRWPGP